MVQREVIKTKSVEFMPFSLSLACFINGACWTAYALIRFDLFITVSISNSYITFIINIASNEKEKKKKNRSSLEN